MSKDDPANPRTQLGGFAKVAVRVDTGGDPSSAVSGARTLESAKTLAAPVGLEGRVVADKYRLLRLIGEGGMGTVWEAEHTSLKKRVAVKLVSAVHSNHPEVAARFKREALATSVIESDHVVQVHDVGTDPQLGLFMIMELLQGEDLAGLLAREGKLDPFVAGCLVAQAAAALARGHRAGIVHRDLKPANLFLARRDDGSVLVKLLDFGIAKFIHDVESQRSGPLTRIGRAIGTAQYMSPEQAQGASAIDARSDVYSLGAVLYEAVAGEPLVPELPTYEQMIIRLLTQPLPDFQAKLPEVDPELARLLGEVLAREPEQRVADMPTFVSRILALYPQALEARVHVAAEFTTGAEPSRPSHAAIVPRIPIALASGGGISVQRTTRLGLGTSAGVTSERALELVSDEPPKPARPRMARLAALVALSGAGLLGVVALVIRLSGHEAEISEARPADSRRAATSTTSTHVPPVVGPPEAGAELPPPRTEQPDAGAPIRTSRSPSLAASRAESKAPARPPAPSKATPSPGARTGTAGVSEDF